MRTANINLYKWEELTPTARKYALDTYRHIETDRWNPNATEFYQDYLLDRLLRLTSLWENMTGIDVVTGSIVFDINTGVKFLTALTANNKILDYYAMQGRKQYEQVQRIKDLKYYKTVVEEVDFSVSYDIEDKETPPNAAVLNGHYYTALTSKTTTNTDYQKLADELKDIILTVAKQISNDIYNYLLELKTEQESDDYLIELFDKRDFWFLSDGHLYIASIHNSDDDVTLNKY